MTIKVGGEVLSFCGSCKMDLGHTVIALAKNKIQKCQCRTCKGIHGYRAPRGVNDPLKYKEAIEKSSTASGKTEGGSGRKRSVKEIITHDAHWETIMGTHKNTPATPYSTKTPFKIGSIIHHPTFGDGFVEKHIHPNKMEVVFKMETKILIHGGSQQNITDPSYHSPASKLFSEK